MPKNFGLYETNIFYRSLRDERVNKLMNMWANELINNSHRDQLSLTYCIWKLNCKDIARIDYLYDEDNNNLYLNEINTIPGVTNTSMYIKLLEYDGNSINYIINELIEKNKR